MARTFLQEFLADSPSTLFNAMRPQVGSRSFTDYFRGREGSVRGDYLGSLGRSALAGVIPTQGYEEFLGTYPWRDYWEGLSPEKRGGRPTAFSPRMTWGG
jgi:hypothetical protein